MTPTEDSDWVILYKIEGAKQKFIGNATIKFEEVSVGGNLQKVGRFEFELPINATSGSYRITYRNTGSGFIDILFNKENVEFVFNPKYPEESIIFIKSRENKVYNEYLTEVNTTQQIIDSLQTSYLKNKSKKIKKAYKKTFKQQEKLQEMYEGKSEGMLAYHFIKASKPSNPSSIISDTEKYLQYPVVHFFNNIDFSNKNLHKSPFFIDKITNYVFYLNITDNQKAQQKLYKESVHKIMRLVKEDALKKEAIEYLITRFTNARNSELVDLLFAKYYDKLPSDFQDSEFKDKKIASLLASVGRPAPDFSWKENGKDFSLSTLNDGENYLLIFWSTQCPHCVKEIPEVYELMKKYTNTSVVAFAIEDDASDFNKFITQISSWHNVLGTHPEDRLKNETFLKYRIDQTPTFFVLDKNKKIVAVPNTIKDITDYFNEKTAK